MLEALRDTPTRRVRAPVQLAHIQSAERRPCLASDVVEPGPHLGQRQCRVVHLHHPRSTSTAPMIAEALRCADRPGRTAIPEGLYAGQAQAAACLVKQRTPLTPPGRRGRYAFDTCRQV